MVLICVLVGELFLTGFFFNTGDTSTSSTMDNTVGRFVINCLAATTLMIPLKIIIAVFLDGNSYSEDMTRKEIELAERRLPYYRAVGFILAGMWIAGCLYGILMYIVTFTEIALGDWASVYFASFLMELILFSQIKVVLKVFAGFLLIKLTKSPLLLGTLGQFISLMIDFSSQFL